VGGAWVVHFLSGTGQLPVYQILLYIQVYIKTQNSSYNYQQVLHRTETEHVHVHWSQPIVEYTHTHVLY